MPAHVPSEHALAEPLKSTVFEETGIPNLLRDRRVDLYYAPSFLLPLWPAAELFFNKVANRLIEGYGWISKMISATKDGHV